MLPDRFWADWVWSPPGAGSMKGLRPPTGQAVHCGSAFPPIHSGPYDKLAMLADRTVLLQAKTYYGGGKWYTLDLDYDRIAAIMREHQYHGYISLEFEGNETPDTGIPKSLVLLRKAFA